MDDDHARDGTDEAADERDRAGDQREEAADERDRMADERDRTADERDRVADQRDRTADDRDRAGQQRDRAADQRDRAAEARDQAHLDFEASLSEELPRAALDHLASLREEAAAERNLALEDRRASAGERGEAERDRAQASADREAGAAQRRQAAADRDAATRALENASIDGLTGAYSRAAGFREMTREIARARRADQPLILAFLDVDRLKVINDTRGHAAGDRMLVDVVHALRDKLRSSDIIMRYGGDEFVCVLPGATFTVAERRLAAVNATLAEVSHPGSVTVGLAELEPADSPEDLVARADAALYRKRQQRFPTMRRPTHQSRSPDQSSRPRGGSS